MGRENNDFKNDCIIFTGYHKRQNMLSQELSGRQLKESDLTTIGTHALSLKNGPTMYIIIARVTHSSTIRGSAKQHGQHKR